MSDSLLKLKDTESKFAFNYGMLLKKIFPYIKVVLSRTLLLFILAIPFNSPKS